MLKEKLEQSARLLNVLASYVESRITIIAEQIVRIIFDLKQFQPRLASSMYKEHLFKPELDCPAIKSSDLLRNRRHLSSYRNSSSQCRLELALSVKGSKIVN